jgi:hypothetical protein
MTQLHETLMGRKLIEGTLPEIARNLKRIADALENQNKEKDAEEPDLDHLSSIMYGVDNNQ